MLAMQYSFTFPADYDMALIRRRIADKGHCTDALPGLVAKAYLYGEREAGGTAENCYAPFYLWQDNAGLNDFLAGPGFQALTRSFGWPAVRVWSLWQAALQPGVADARWGTRAIRSVAPHGDLAAMQREEEAQLAAALAAGALAVAAGFEPTTWSVVRFRLWAERPAAEEENSGQLYRVGHVSLSERS